MATQEASEGEKPKRARRAPAVEKPAAGTEYIILERVDPDNEGTWKPYKKQISVSAEQAIKTATKQGDGTQMDGAWKAVPLRNWKGGKLYVNEVKPVTKAEDLH